MGAPLSVPAEGALVQRFNQVIQFRAAGRLAPQPIDVMT
jgi:hypothetical protein